MSEKPLINYEKGEIVTVSCLNCGCNLGRRFCEMGLYDGAEIKVIKNDQVGPLIVEVLGSKIAIGRGEAAKIKATKLKK